MSIKNLILCVTFLLCHLKPCEPVRILCAVFTPSYSHQLTFRPIWRELSSRGHTLTILTTDPMNDPSLTNLTEIDLSESYQVMKSHKTDEIVSRANESILMRFFKYMDALHAVSESQMAHPKVQDLIRNGRDQFDLLLVEVIYPTQMAFSWWFGVPFIGIMSLDAPSRVHTAMGNPVHPVLYPSYDLPFDVELTFFERLISFLFECFMGWYSESTLYPREEGVVRRHLADNAPSLREIQKNMSMLFINTHPVFHNVRAVAPSTVQIGGGLHLEKPQKLSKNLQQYLDSSNQGFVYFSLGGNVKSAALQNRTKSAIIDALAALPYNVLWKFEDETIKIPPNVKIMKWIPSQTAVLAHHNIKAFITQCGLQSMEEAIFYNVPMVGLSFYGDQGKNAKALHRKKLGVKLDYKTLKKEELLNAILEVSSNSVYRKNLKITAELLQDEAMSGVKKAVWWTEYVLRHKGADHLKSSSAEVPLYQYLLLDVVGFLLGILILLLCVLVLILTMFFKLLKFVRRVFKGKTKNKKE